MRYISLKNIKAEYQGGVNINIDGLEFVNKDICTVDIELNSSCSLYKKVTLTFKPNKADITHAKGIVSENGNPTLKFISSAKMTTKDLHFQFTDAGMDAMEKVSALGASILFQYIRKRMDFGEPLVDFVNYDFKTKTEVRRFLKGVKNLAENRFLERYDNSHARRYYINFMYIRRGGLLNYLNKLVGSKFRDQVIEAVIQAYEQRN